MGLSPLLLAALCGGGLPWSAKSDELLYDVPTEVSRLRPGTLGAVGDKYFGWSVALAGSTAVVGAQKGRGVYVIEEGWDVTTILTRTYPVLGEPEDGFGYAVAATLSEDGTEKIVAVGAVKDAHGPDELDTGAVYIFTKPMAESSGGSWNLTQRIAPGDLRSGDYFGAAVSLHGDRLLVGAHRGDGSGGGGGNSDGSDGNANAETASDAGRAFVYERRKGPEGRGGGFMLTQELVRAVESPSAQYDYFGMALSLDGDLAVVGAHNVDLPAAAKAGRDDGQEEEEEGAGQQQPEERTNVGAAYVFRCDGSSWYQEAELVSADGAAHDYFGSSVAVRGDFVLVGAPGADLGTTASTSTTTGRRRRATTTGGNENEEGQDDEEEDEDDGRLLVNTGKVYLFRRESKDKKDKRKKVWRQHQEIVAPDAEQNDQFGAALSLGQGGRTAVVGARADDDMGSASGAAYAFVSRDNKAKLVLSGKMLPSDGAAGDFFGFSIAMDQTDDNGRVLVGADLKGSDMSGAAYIFGVPVGQHSMAHRGTSGKSDAPDAAALIAVYAFLCLVGAAGLVWLVCRRDDAMRCARECCSGGGEAPNLKRELIRDADASEVRGSPRRHHHHQRLRTRSDYESESGGWGTDIDGGAAQAGRSSAVAAALGGEDLTTTTAGVRLPGLAIDMNDESAV